MATREDGPGSIIHVGTAITRQQFLVRSLAAAAAGGGAASLIAACGGSSSEPSDGAQTGRPPARPTGTLVVALGSAPVTLDVARRAVNADFVVTQQIFEGLTRWKPDFSDVEPALVSSWTVSDDGREWVGQIRQNVKFHDGTEFDSTAVKKNFQYYLKSAGGFTGLLLPGFKEIDDSDPGVIRLVSKEPFPDLTTNLPLGGMMSPRVIAKGPKAIDKSPIGTGPFRFASQGSNAWTLERNPEYWDQPRPHLEEAEMTVVADLGGRLAALRTGQINLTTAVPPSQIPQLKRDSSKVRIASSPSWTVSHLAFKLMQPPVDQLPVRQAIAHSLDLAAVAKAVMREQAEPANAFIPPGAYGHQPMEPQYPYDPDKAKSLLQSVGSGGPADISLAVPSGGSDPAAFEDMAQAFGEQMRAVGFNVKVDAIEEGLFGKELGEEQPRHNVFLLSYPYANGGPLIFQLLTYNSISSLAAADTALDGRITELTTEMNTTPNGAARMSVIKEIQDLLAENLVHLPVFFNRANDALSADVRGYTAPADGEGPHLNGVYIAA